MFGHKKNLKKKYLLNIIGNNHVKKMKTKKTIFACVLTISIYSIGMIFLAMYMLPTIFQ
jgi:hypothetical protein